LAKILDGFFDENLAIQDQTQVIADRLKELQSQLDLVVTHFTDSKAKQYTYAITCGDRDEKSLDDLFARLDRAKADLAARIPTEHVGLSGTMRAGFIAALAIVQRID
jgi:hypothetical protein